MALYLPIRAISRSQQVRIGGQRITRDETHYVDIEDGRTRRDLERHQALGAVITVGGLSATDSEWVVVSGVTVNEGADDTDLDVTVVAGELFNRATGEYISVAGITDVTLDAADTDDDRIDIIQVNTTTGVATEKAGTPATEPVAPSPDAGNIVVAEIAVDEDVTAVVDADITDVRPRP